MKYFIKSAAVIGFFLYSLISSAQEKNVALYSALGLYRDELISVLGKDYKLQKNENGSAILSYDIKEYSTSSGNYEISCMFLLYSNYECYYITAMLPATEYKRTTAYMDYAFKKTKHNEWQAPNGRTITASLDVYDSGSIFTLTFF